MKAEQLKDLSKCLRDAIWNLSNAADIVDEQFEKQEARETACRGGQRPLKDDIGEPIMGSK